MTQPEGIVEVQALSPGGADLMITHLVGYLFYLSNTGDNGVRYRKTLDGGLTWSDEKAPAS